MAITIDLPHVGESVVEGVIGKWLKQPGDKLQRYDPIVEVVTDKVTMEVPSPVEGVLSRLLVEEGETVPMGAPIAEIETDEAQTPASQPGRSPAPEAVSTIGYLVKDVQPVGPTGGGMEEEPSADVAVAGSPGEDRARYSPAVRRLAREHNIDPGRVKGTGIGGRVTRNDVLGYLESQAARAAQAPTMTPARVEPRPQVSRTAAPSHTPAHTPAAGPATQEAGSEDRVLDLTPIRRIIAQNMVKSATEIPHAWSMVEVDVNNLVRYRESLKEEFQRREGVDLTYLPFVIKAVVESLKDHPMLNSTWGGDKIILKKRVHVGIAVAAPDGLVVPVIHDADSLSIAGLARAGRELTNKARQGRLALQDVQGGTFTLNNTGALGSIVSQPLINPPQAAILTTEAIQKRPVVVDDAIAIHSMMNICLSFDHRIIDGSESGAFLQSIKGRLEAMGQGTPIY
jgi:2-oxoisovalerate dehydrogenase E2 component (dihydrolipoyl transacylase)